MYKQQFFSDTSLLIQDHLTDFIVFKSPQELSDEPISRTFDVTRHAKKPITLVQGSKYF